MINLLIVDDEPLILKSLCEMVQENREDDFTVYSASSVAQAIKILDEIWIDLILSDIRMPDVDGLQLMRKVENDWPNCKMIFLTGHSEFEYARQAVSPCVLSYVLKLEGDGKILEALDKAHDMIRAEFLVTYRRMVLESDFQKAKPILQAEFMRYIISGNQNEEIGSLESRIKIAGIQLEITKPILIATVLLQPTWEAIKKAQVQETVEKLISEYYVLTSAMILPEVLVIAAQAKNGESHPIHFLGLLEKASEHCLYGGYSAPRILLYGEAVSIFDSAKAYTYLNQRRFAWPVADGVQLCIPDNPETKSPAMRDKPVMGIFRVEAISNSLAYANQEEYLNLSEKLLSEAFESTPLEMLAIYTTMSSLLLQAITNYLPQDTTVLSKIPLSLLGNIQSHNSFPDAFRFLSSVAENYFAARQKVSTDIRSYVIHAVNRYITEHIQESIGLTQIATQVHLHPSYLSRIYKESTGISINQYIVAQRIQISKALLADPLIKISEIVTKTGLNAPSYFTYYFKKHEGITPQDYRSKIVSGNNLKGRNE